MAGHRTWKDLKLALKEENDWLKSLIAERLHKENVNLRKSFGWTNAVEACLGRVKIGHAAARNSPGGGTLRH
ncbi:hypothetical protein EN962_02575 [Mesorhizobium sp. M7A.F.Ca.CA.001.09.2.1]|uniref:Transposase n=1 Tax=Mesorhizobium ciceri TaxID=39645 RepID=A0AB38TFM7_9HYPH|nr:MULTISPECIES: hypothetical protein [Mesorhizobium]RUY59631.1 hypothetical protein EN981_00080 [Mesorhizobium sp. M7A.F.Ca.CA.001.13.2.1]MDF3218052.1 hypothetical protein [Mesorhizobium ciceri]RUY70263.1 hypothetical protein EN980_09085 [Mesorhizobium sp. M7A.F.Ca.CA.001.13.1.1]RUY71220.1 hypothetical protein EN965_08570 [Mesorhizobium sp. M7A.F.Ca.CA.001.05.1.1]RUY81237.1 hypothetical protein EN962_02575 [Mesorhizobium sp. M7A.F.Ca.CA.001.09.2.1]